MENFTTKDTPTAVYLKLKGHEYKLEQVGRDVWFNFPKEAENDAKEFIYAWQVLKAEVSKSIKIENGQCYSGSKNLEIY